MGEDDKALVSAVLAGRTDAFERLVAAHQRLVWHVVSRMCGNAEDARDLCQDTFLRVHRTLPQFRFESSLATWIGRVAFSVAANALQRKQVPLLEPGSDGEAPWVNVAGSDYPDLELHRSQVRRLVLASVAALAPLERTLITLYHLEELSIAQISVITGVPEGTVKNYLFRARRRLRDRLLANREALA